MFLFIRRHSRPEEGPNMFHTNSKTIKIARILLGLTFAVFGLNFFLQFMPMPPQSGSAGAFLGALFATGYMFPLIKVTEIVGGALLMAGRATPFALVLLAPVVVNILAFHLVLDPAGAGLSLLLTSLMAIVAWAHRDAFKPLFTSATPAKLETQTPLGATAGA
jgi:uncharacterized membrane protein YphA (DoxX/SURF4 family)